MKTAFVLLCCALVTGNAAQPSRSQAAQSSKRTLESLERSREENLRRKAELDRDIARLGAERDTVLQGIALQEAQISKLNEQIAFEEAEQRFLSGPALQVSDVTGLSILVDFPGMRRWVTLNGIRALDAREGQLDSFLRRRLLKKSVYVRCAEATCSNVEVYIDRKASSLNVELVQLGLATLTPQSGIDLSRSSSPSPESSKEASPSISGTSAPGKDVQVRGYTRKDGTRVRPHTRSAPGTKKP